MAFYAARQPILDINRELFAYEVLYRDGVENVFPDIEEDQATTKLIEGLQLSLGLDNLAKEAPAFINFTHETLMQGHPVFLPNDRIVVEILETVKPGKKLLKACQDLKSKGYILALDDYEHQNVWRHFYPIVDIIKIDLRATSFEEVETIKLAIKDFPHIKLLAEKVETYDEFNKCVDMGFEYFQGYFFSAPEMMTSKSMDPGQLQLAELLYETSKPEVDVNVLTKTFERDVSLSFKLLRYANSASFARRSDIETIKQAIVVLGNEELKKFLSLLFTANINSEKPSELIRLSMTRAHFCELVGATLGNKQEASMAFLTGMMSLIDAIMDQSIEDLMEKLPLAQAIKDALIKKEGKIARYLALIQCYEKADWDSAQSIIDELNLDKDTVPVMYHKAVTWANEQADMSD